MKFGLTGDTHNNLKNIKIICDIFNNEDINFVVHTGDITLPKSLEAFNKLKMPLKGVFGNNDQEEKESLSLVCNKYGFEFDDGPKKLSHDGRDIYIVHDPLDIEDYFYGRNNIIVHGHTHRFRDEQIHETYIFNPGECAGMMNGKNNIGIVDLFKNSMRIVNF